MKVEQICYNHIELSEEEINTLVKARQIVNELIDKNYYNYSTEEGEWRPEVIMRDTSSTLRFIIEHPDVEY